MQSYLPFPPGNQMKWMDPNVLIYNCSNNKEPSSHYNLGESAIVINLESKKEAQRNLFIQICLCPIAAEVRGGHAQLLFREWPCQMDSLHHIRKASLNVSTCMNPICWSDEELIWRSIYIQGREHKSVAPAVWVKLQSMLQLFDRSSIVCQKENSTLE